MQLMRYQIAWRRWPLLLCAWLVYSNLVLVHGAHAQTPARADSIILELGCGGCHAGVPFANELREKAPDLSSAGRLYQPAYLFDYLQHPRQVRRHIGRSRMPDFKFDEKEALALVLFLQAQTYRDPQWPAFPAPRRSSTAGRR